MRILVTGANGMLGLDLVDVFAERGWEVIPTDVAELDLTDPIAVATIPEGAFGKLDWIVNCAAYTAVDRAETERQLATEINTFAPGYLGRAASLAGCRLLHVSTDFVFDGKTDRPYREDDPAAPLGVYGLTKLEGETAALGSGCGAVVARTSWLFGPRGTSFPKTMIRAFEAGKTLRVVADQVGNPTYTVDLARTLAEIVDKAPEPGVYHASGPETLSWHSFASRVLRLWTESDVPIEPISTEAWPTPAARPRFSALDYGKLLGLGVKPMRSLDDAIAEFCLRLRSFGPVS